VLAFDGSRFCCNRNRPIHPLWRMDPPFPSKFAFAPLGRPKDEWAPPRVCGDFVMTNALCDARSRRSIAQTYVKGDYSTLRYGRPGVLQFGEHSGMRLFTCVKPPFQGLSAWSCDVRTVPECRRGGEPLPRRARMRIGHDEVVRSAQRDNRTDVRRAQRLRRANGTSDATPFSARVRAKYCVVMRVCARRDVVARRACARGSVAFHVDTPSDAYTKEGMLPACSIPQISVSPAVESSSAASALQPTAPVSSAPLLAPSTTSTPPSLTSVPRHQPTAATSPSCAPRTERPRQRVSCCRCCPGCCAWSSSR
jgi:hypothetical protein